MKARLAFAGLAAEAIPILLLIGMVALFGPREPVAAQAYAEKMGRWVGPIAGTLACLAGARWASRDRPLFQGATVGLIAAAIDIALLVVSGAAFQWLFVLSNLGRVLAGLAGGALARAKNPERVA
jgi:hypothetical protein